MLKWSRLLLAGPGEESFDVRRPGRGGSPQREDCGADGQDQPAGAGELHPEGARQPGDPCATVGDQHHQPAAGASAGAGATNAAVAAGATGAADVSCDAPATALQRLGISERRAAYLPG